MSDDEPAGVNALRRGACPGISDPMPTGDGLLARLPAEGPMPIAAFQALCDAGMACGNGILEITQRGSLQIRGLSADSSAEFARRVSALGLGQHPSPYIVASPLLGLDTEETNDLRPLLYELRRAFANDRAFSGLGPKVSVVLDSGGTMSLDDVSADVRLRYVSGSEMDLSIAGDAANAAPLGTLLARDALDMTVRVLGVIARHGPLSRAKDWVSGGKVDALREALGSALKHERRTITSAATPSVGVHRLNNDRRVLAVALPFGYANAAMLSRFARYAAEQGASDVETAPSRILLIIGMNPEAASRLTATAAELGLIVRADDPRRFIMACAGAPACGSALLATRDAAQAFARASPALLDGSVHIHVSGCRKGCAHPGVAALTFIGPDGLVIDGRAGDAPPRTLSLDQAALGLARLDAARSACPHAYTSSAQMLAALGSSGILAAMTRMP